MIIVIVDGQGGGLGKILMEKLTAAGLDAELLGIGTNAAATAALSKGGAHQVATGENAVIYNAGRADIVVGGIGILCANAMMGEISPAIAVAIASCNAVKVLVPLNRCNLRVSGVPNTALHLLVNQAVADVIQIASARRSGAEA